MEGNRQCGYSQIILNPPDKLGAVIGGSRHRRLLCLDVVYASVYLPLMIAGAAFAAWYGIAVVYNHSAADGVYDIIIDAGRVGIAAAKE